MSDKVSVPITNALFGLSTNALSFPLAPTSPTQRTVTFTNLLKDTSIAYKVQTNKPKEYNVRPGSDIIEPGASREVLFFLLPRKDAAAAQPGKSKDKFKVLCAPVPRGSPSDIRADEVLKSVPAEEIVDERVNVYFTEDESITTLPTSDEATQDPLPSQTTPSPSLSPATSNHAASTAQTTARATHAPTRSQPDAERAGTGKPATTYTPSASATSAAQATSSSVKTSVSTAQARKPASQNAAEFVLQEIKSKANEAKLNKTAEPKNFLASLKPAYLLLLLLCIFVLGLQLGSFFL